MCRLKFGKHNQLVYLLGKLTTLHGYYSTKKTQKYTDSFILAVGINTSESCRNESC